MEGGDYSNRELDHMFKDIQDTLKRIEEQTTKTNGRVNNLESWRQYTLGALGVVTFLVIPLVVYFFNSSLNRIVEVQQPKTNINVQQTPASN